MIDDEVRRWLLGLQQGQNVSTKEFTLAVTPATSTVVSSQACSSGSAVLLIPVDAGAATEWGGTSLYVTAGKKEFTVNHSASASTRTFRCVVFTNTRQI